MDIDSHQHFWKLDRGDYGWLTPDLAPIHRDFLPAELGRLIEAAGVERTILVQAAPSEAETLFLLDMADDTPFVAGVVGWVDLEAADAAHRIATLARRPKLKGLRPMIEDLADDGWMLRPTLAPALTTMIDCGLTFDALVRPRHLPILRRFAVRYPGLAIVIDHAAKPDIASGDLTEWSEAIGAIAAETTVACKLSGLITEAAPGWTEATLRPVVARLLETFGPRRLMWGSDWPVLNLNGDYSGWRAAARSLLAHLPRTDREWIFGRTASGAYRLAA